jgi:predicted lipid-binding transport protein (Tim44 family)
MTVGGTLFVQALNASYGMNLGRMVGGMMTGMVWGMVISVALYRLYFSVTDYFQMKKRLSHIATPGTN